MPTQDEINANNNPDVTPPAAPPPTAPPIEEAAAPSKKEWVDFHKTQRAINQKLEELTVKLAKVEAPKPAPALPEVKDKPGGGEPIGPDPMARIAQLEANLALKEAIVEQGLSLTREQRVLVEKLYKADGQIADVSAWLADTATAMGVSKKAADSQTKPPVTPSGQGVSDAGAPAKAGGGSTPGTFADLDPATFRALPLEERRKLTSKLLAAGGHQNPFRRTGK